MQFGLLHYVGFGSKGNGRMAVYWDQYVICLCKCCRQGIEKDYRSVGCLYSMHHPHVIYSSSAVGGTLGQATYVWGFCVRYTHT